MPRPPVFRLHNHSGRAARFSNMRAALHLPLRALVAGAVLAVALPCLPAQASAKAREPNPLEIFQNSEDRLFRVGYRLATANVAFCPQTVPVSGLMIHDAESYGDPEAVRKLFGLDGDIGIQAVAPGSPAAKAGLSQNDTLLALDGQRIAPHWPRTEPRWQRVFALRDAIDAALARGSARTDLAKFRRHRTNRSYRGHSPALPVRTGRFQGQRCSGWGKGAGRRALSRTGL